VIIRGIVDVFNLFVEMDDPSRPGMKFLAGNVRTLVLKELAYVCKGLLSDKPGVRMYVKKGIIAATGFVRYRCRRTTSALEVARLPIHSC